MVTIENIRFPYPILCNFNDDYKNIDFYAGVYNKVLIKTKRTSKFEVLVNVNNDNKIIDMINNDDLKILLKVYCLNTKLRQVYTLKLGINEIVLDNRDINKRVDLEIIIVANKDIQNYTNINFNNDYYGKNFNLEKGSVFAIGNRESLYIEKDINEFTKVNSVITIVKADEETFTMVDYTGEKIRIKLSKESFEKYELYAKYSTALVNQMVVVPAIMYVLDSLVDMEKYDYEDKKWFRVISKRASDVLGKDFNIEYIKQVGSIELVQKMFNNPLNEGLVELEKLYIK